MQAQYRKAHNGVTGKKNFSVYRLMNTKIVKGFSLGNIFWTAVFACLSHVFIDIRFEPYGFAVYPDDLKLTLAIGYGLVLGTGFYVGHILIKNEKLFWPVWKELIWVLLMTVVITVVNYFYRLFIIHSVFDSAGIYEVSFLRYMLVGAEVAGSTALVFKFFQTILIKSDRIEKYKTDSEPIIEENNHDTKAQQKQKCVQGNNSDEVLYFYPDNLVFVRSHGNYVKVFIQSKFSGKMEKHMLRLSMSGFEKQVENIQFLKRIHKSYLINENHITKINGNSKKAYLMVMDDVKIPLRRDLYKYYKDFLKAKANNADAQVD